MGLGLGSIISVNFEFIAVHFLLSVFSPFRFANAAQGRVREELFLSFCCDYKQLFSTQFLIVL